MKLSEWISQFSEKYAQYLDELGEMGESTASTIFGTAPGDDGNTDVSVSRAADEENGFRIVASGHDAMFMEFGTGVMTTVVRDTVQSDIPIENGSWSAEALASGEQGGGEYARFDFDYWHWNGVHWTGTAPLGGMQEACSAMEQWSPTIAKRVFGG